MAKKNTPKSRRVTIPAGKEYVTFDPKTDKVFVVTPGVIWPAELTAFIESEAARLAKVRESRASQNVTVRMYSPQESAVEALTAIRRHGMADQNKIVAIVLNEVAASRHNQVAALQNDIEEIEKRLVNAVDMQKQFADIQQGKFVAII